MTDVTSTENRDVAELSAADEQLLKELTERGQGRRAEADRRGRPAGQADQDGHRGCSEGEMDGHLGYSRHDPTDRDGENSRNGHSGKTVLTEAGPAGISVPRDRDSSLEPKIVAKSQPRLMGIEDTIISLSAKMLTYGEISIGMNGHGKASSTTGWGGWHLAVKWRCETES